MTAKYCAAPVRTVHYKRLAACVLPSQRLAALRSLVPEGAGLPARGFF